MLQVFHNDFKFLRFYKDDKSEGSDKWSQVTINELYRILEDLDLHKVLLAEFDKRKKFFRDLKMNQLRTECRTRNLDHKGKKVHVKW